MHNLKCALKNVSCTNQAFPKFEKAINAEIEMNRKKANVKSFCEIKSILV